VGALKDSGTGSGTSGWEGDQETEVHGDIKEKAWHTSEVYHQEKVEV
jgi:hypothetical protein